MTQYPGPLSDAEIQAMWKRCKEKLQFSLCGEYSCDCHWDLPRVLEELKRLREFASLWAGSAAGSDDVHDQIEHAYRAWRGAEKQEGDA